MEENNVKNKTWRAFYGDIHIQIQPMEFVFEIVK